MKSVTLVALNAKYCHTSLAVRSIGAACIASGIKTKIIEHSVNEPFRLLMRNVLEHESDVYAFSCYLWNIDLVRQICTDLKRINPSCQILLGGPEVSYDPEEYYFADAVVCGEGEISVPQYLMGKVCGPVIQGVPVEPLDKLSFCYSQEDLEQNKHRLIYYESSRGCPFSCSYCLSSIEQGVRFMSVERVCRDLKRFDMAGVDLVKFVDRTFNANRKRASAIWKFAAEQCHHTRFHFELAGDLLTEEQLTYLATVEQGKFQFEIGIQSTHSKTLEAVDRKSDCSQLFDRIRRLMEVGNIHVHTDLIVGMPYETYSLFQQSFNDVYSLKTNCLQVGFLKLLKGSKIRREAERWNYRYSGVAPYEIYENAFLSYRQVTRLEMVAQTVERYYNSGAFSHSIEYAIAKYSSPFSFYEAFSKEFDGMGSIAQKKLYEILYYFFIRSFGEDPLFSQWLRFDWLYQTKGAPVPSYLGTYPTMQPLLFQLLDVPYFCETYLPQYAALKKKEIIKRVFLAQFQLPQSVYYLFDDGKTIDVTKECLKMMEGN